MAPYKTQFGDTINKKSKVSNGRFILDWCRQKSLLCVSSGLFSIQTFFCQNQQKIFHKPPLIRSPSYKPPTLQVIGTCKRKSIHPILYAALAPRDLRPIQIMTFSVQLNEKKKTSFDPVPDPDLEIRGRGGGHPDPQKKEGGGLQNDFFRPFGPQFGLKIRGLRGLPSMRHCDQHCYSLFRIRAFSIPFLSSPRAYKL